MPAESPNDDTTTCNNPSARPLPPLPFNHTTKFKLQGTRIVQDPASNLGIRKTAVQTLIARYEGSLPLPNTPTSTNFPTGTHNHSPTTNDAYDFSPITPRLLTIRDAFSPDPLNPHLAAYLSSTDLLRYNTTLSDFRSRIRTHLSWLVAEMAKIHTIQTDHTAAKVLAMSTSASSSSSSSRSASRRSAGPTRRGGEDGMLTPTSKKKTRIQYLRNQGWDVRKEKFGFKGEAFYEELRRRVESELDEVVVARMGGTGGGGGVLV
jgi:hypothetical protein